MRGTRKAFNTPLFVLLGMTLVFSPSRAEEQQADPNTAATAEQQNDEKSEKPAKTTTPPTSVVVEGELPYVPTSNTIATRLPLEYRFTPTNIGTVSDLLVREQYGLVLGDALRNVSGVNPQSISNVVDFFVIRGFDSESSGLVLIDGAAEPEVTYYQMYNVDRVEVLKGPGGFLYGSNPLAGAVNIVRRQPMPGTFGSAGFNGGSYGTWDSRVDYNTSSHDGVYAFRLNSTWRESDFYRDEMDNRNSAVNPAFTWRPNSQTSLNVNLEYVDTEYVPDSGLPLFNNEIPDVSRRRSYQAPFDDSDQTIERAQVDFEKILGSTWSLRNKLYYRDLDWESDGTIFNGVFPSFITGRPEVNRSELILDDHQRFVGDRFEAVLSAFTGKVAHKVLLGVEAQQLTDDFTLDFAALPSIDLFAPDETAQEPLTAFPLSAGEWNSRVIAPFAIDQMTFSEKFHALVGARFDSIDWEDDLNSLDRSDSEVSPMGGVVYSPTSVLSFYANAGKSFAPPSSRLMSSLVETADPQRSVQYEVGTKIDCYGGKLQTTIALYDMERENIPIPDNNGFTTTAGDQRSRGVELELSAVPMSGMRAFLSYAYNDSELTRFSERIVVGVDPNTFQPIFGTVDRSDNKAAFAPKHLVNLWVSHKFNSGIGVAGGGRYASTQFIAEDNAFKLEPYVVLDAAVFYTMGNWDFSLNVKNLTDEEYETRALGSNVSVIPATARAAYAGVQYRF